MKFFHKQSKGFTLIELLVVISIIGILSVVVYASFGQARQQSRDKSRMASLKEVQLAIELYKAQNGVYPLAGCSLGGYGPGNYRWAGSETYSGGLSVISCPDNYISGLVPDFISRLPKEVGPVTLNKGYIYTVTPTRTSYKLMTHHDVETLFVTGFDHKFARYPSANASGCPATFPQGENDVYAVYSAGAECW